jgi:DNA-binding Xre family transcriptional regulator
MIRLRVKKVAEQKHISMGKLSRTADVAYNTIKAIYCDPYKEVTTTTLNKIATALGVPASELIEDVPEKKANHSGGSYTSWVEYPKHETPTAVARKIELGDTMSP